MPFTINTYPCYRYTHFDVVLNTFRTIQRIVPIRTVNKKLSFKQYLNAKQILRNEIGNKPVKNNHKIKSFRKFWEK